MTPSSIKVETQWGSSIARSLNAAHPPDSESRADPEAAETILDETEISIHAAGQLAELDDLAQQTRDYIGQAKSDNTVRAYRSDWADFSAWCGRVGRQSLPAAPETVALYLSAQARTLKASTIQRRLSAISQAHLAAELETPIRSSIVRTTWQGIRRIRGVAQTGKTPALAPDIKEMVDRAPYSLRTRKAEARRLIVARDRALLLVGFFGAFRRSELVALERHDVESTVEGLVITIRRSKTDQEGAGRTVGLPFQPKPSYCPVRVLEEWLDLAKLTNGPLFRPVNQHGHVGGSALTPASLALIVKRAARAAGLDPKDYAGHSLRAGFATSAAADGATERAIQDQTGHKSVTVLRRYIRRGKLFDENAAAVIRM